MAKKNVYFFGGGKAEGKAAMKNLLGGKGANLAEMSSLGVPVPAGFTITTEVCTEYYKNKGRLPKVLTAEVNKALARTEKVMGKKYGDPKNPLLVSVRSGARQSMPGMMDTVLNVGLSSKTLPGLIAKSGDERFAYDAYRRLIMMYADVVMEKAAGIEAQRRPLGARERLEHAMEALKKKRGVTGRHRTRRRTISRRCATSSRSIVKKVIGKALPG